MKSLNLAISAFAVAFVILPADTAFAKKKGSDPSVPLAISAKDKKIGAEAHPKLLEEFGGLYTGPQAAYVTQVGRKIALQSGLSNAEGDFTISLLNSSVNNAFAIPGGYVYVTRQLMGLMNDEAELASVLGHEVGHVAARHSDKRNSRATTGQLGAIAATVLGAVLGGGEGAKLGSQIGGSLATRWVLKYSRSQEYEADDLGVRYLVKAGYDPQAASSMLASLAAQTALDARRAGKNEKALPEWASTHPDPAARVVRAQQTATATGSKNTLRSRDAFIAQLDGMLYDDDPKQGVIDGQSFRHPDLKLQFNAPSGYVMANGTTAVSINGSGGRAQFSNGNHQGDLKGFVSKVFQSLGGGQQQINHSPVETRTINGLPVAFAKATATQSSGQTVDVMVHAYEFDSSSAYFFLTLTPGGQGIGPFNSLIESLRRMSASEAAAVKPRRIDVVTVKSGDNIQSLANRMAYDDYKLERFLVLNNLQANSTLKSGQKVKLIQLDK